MAKYCYALILLSLSVSFNINAQDGYFGIKGGYNASSLNSSEESDIEVNNRHAYNISMVYSHFNQKLGYSIELGYTLKGADIGHDTLDYKFHYINMPLLIDFYPIKQLKISAGPEISYLLSAKNHSNDTTSQSLLNTYDKRLEVSGLVSASASLTYFMDVGIRYSHSFTKVSKYDALIDRKNLYNSYLQFFILFKIAN